MPTTLTEIAKFETAALDVPASGDARTAASVEDPFQDLANRTKYARGATWGSLVGGDEFSITGSSNTVFTASVNAFEALVAQDTTGVFWPRFSTADTTWSLADVSGSPANLSNSTSYHCYLGVNTDGSLRKLISTTGPGASKVWKSDAADQWRFMGFFHTTSAGVPIAARCVRGHYLYRRSNQAIADTRVLTGGVATAYTSVDLSALVPSYARVALLRYELTNTANQFNYAFLGTDGDSGADAFLIALQDKVAAITAGECEIETDSGQDVQYKVTANGAAASLELFVGGFRA